MLSFGPKPVRGLIGLSNTRYGILKDANHEFQTGHPFASLFKTRNELLPGLI